MDAQNTQEGDNSKSILNSGEFLMFDILSKVCGDELEEMPDIKEAEIAGIGGENDKEDSRCTDSSLQILVDGIVGILEGFGLLDYNIDESVLDEISEFIVSIANNEGENIDTNTDTDYIDTLSQIIARMPNAEQLVPLTQEAEAAIEQLIGEYQCSFDNTNNSGVEETEQENESPQSQEAEIIGADKVKMMLKGSIDKAGGLKIKQFGTIDEKASDESENNGDTDSASSKTLVFERPSEALETTGYQTDESIEQVTQDDMAENVAKIAESITSRQIEGKQEFDVTLKPEFLGKLSIKLVMDGESIKAHIKAADQYVRGLISEQLPELSQALKDRGINMSNIEVTYESPMFSSTDQQFQGQSQNMGTAGQGVRSYALNENDIESVSFIDATDQTDLLLKNSSVEFSA